MVIKNVIANQLYTMLHTFETEGRSGKCRDRQPFQLIETYPWREYCEESWDCRRWEMIFGMRGILQVKYDDLSREETFYGRCNQKQLLRRELLCRHLERSRWSQAIGRDCMGITKTL